MKTYFLITFQNAIAVRADLFDKKHHACLEGIRWKIDAGVGVVLDIKVSIEYRLSHQVYQLLHWCPMSSQKTFCQRKSNVVFINCVFIPIVVR